MEDYALDVENLAVKHRAKTAFRSLMAGGSAASAFVRQGLHHEDVHVVIACCDLLDHFLYEDAVPYLIGLLNHENGDVRARAMHALACDRCKEGFCRPGEDDSLPMALSMLDNDPSPRVRVEAVALVFAAVHRRADVAEALEHARDFDTSPNVRKQAGLRAPGGVLYRRTSPHRAERAAARKHLTAHYVRS
jgi:HEAT repeat protein